MADDLKSMMTKLMTSKGTKKFFFAYGGGKRKDGKGDGEFAVATKKVKKADIEGKLAAPKEVLEGTCWLGTGEDAGTVFLKGKSISGTAVSKMALTAKLLAGRQFDFQIPSPEEEARAEAIKDSEADGEGEGKEGSSEETAPQETPTEQPLDSKSRLAALKKRVDEVFAKDPEARKSKLLPTYQLAEHLVNSGKEDKAPEALDRLETALGAFSSGGAPSEGGDGKKEETKPSGPEAAFQSRVKALQPEVDKAVATGTPAGKEAKLRMSEAKLHGERKKDFPSAMAALAAVEEQVKLAIGSAPKEKEDGKSSGKDLAAEYKAKLAEWTPVIKTAMTKSNKGPMIARALARATSLSKPGGDFAQALENLTEAFTLAGGTAPSPKQEKKEETESPEGETETPEPKKKSGKSEKPKGEGETEKEEEPKGEGETATEEVKEEEEEEEAEEPVSFEEGVKAMEAALKELKPDNPFARSVQMLFDSFKDTVQTQEKLVAQGMLKAEDVEKENDARLKMVTGEIKAAQKFADAADAGRKAIEGLPSGDPVREVMLGSFNSELGRFQSLGSAASTASAALQWVKGIKQQATDRLSLIEQADKISAEIAKLDGENPFRGQLENRLQTAKPLWSPNNVPAAKKDLESIAQGVENAATVAAKLAELAEAPNKSFGEEASDPIRAELAQRLDSQKRGMATTRISESFGPIMKSLEAEEKDIAKAVDFWTRCEGVRDTLDQLSDDNPELPTLETQFQTMGQKIASVKQIPDGLKLLDLLEKKAKAALAKGKKETEEEGEEDDAAPEETAEVENELDVKDGEDEADEDEDTGSGESEEPDAKPIDLTKFNVAELKAAMTNLRVVEKKFAKKLPKSAFAELGDLKQLEKVGYLLVKSAGRLMHYAKRSDEDKVKKHGQRAHQAFQELEGLVAALDTALTANAYQDGKKGPEFKKEYKSAMKWYTDGKGRGGFQACLAKVKTSLQM